MNEYFYSAVFNFSNEGRWQESEDGVHETEKSGREAYLELKRKLRDKYIMKSRFRSVNLIAFNKID